MAQLGNTFKKAQGALNMGTGLLGLYSAANPGEDEKISKYAGIMNNLSSIGNSVISNGLGGSTALLRNGKGNGECLHCKHMEKYMKEQDIAKKYRDGKSASTKLHKVKPKASDKKLAEEYYAKGVEKEYKNGKC